MKLPLTKEGCKTLSFYSIAISIVLTVLLSLLSIWEITTSEVGSRLMYSLYTILGGIIVFTFINFLFVIVEQDRESWQASADEPSASKSTMADALKKAKQRDTDAD